MINDLAQHKKLIYSFRGLSDKKDFTLQFDLATTHLLKTEKLLLKIELNRLDTVCKEIIDLRGLVDSKCTLFDYLDQSHFLDQVAIEVFNENIQAYGSYTLGVYEAVHNTKNNFKNIAQNKIKTSAIAPEKPRTHQNNTSAIKVKYPAKLYSFDNYPDRCEERMNSSTVLTLKLINKVEVQVKSTDLSVKGLKFRLTNDIELNVGDLIRIRFTRFNNIVQANEDAFFSYQVKNIQQDNEIQCIGCCRINYLDGDNLSLFLSDYIEENKKRFKINVQNSLSAIEVRRFEQFSLVKLNELVIFMEVSTNLNKDQVDNLLPRYALTTINNEHIHQYWQNEQRHSTLNYLIDTKRFSRLKSAKNQGKKLLVYSFIHHYKDEVYFYSLDDQEIEPDDIFFIKFLAYAASKESFAITMLDYHEIRPEQGHSPFTLSNALTKDQTSLNPPPSTEVNLLLANLPFVVTAIDLTKHSHTIDYQLCSFKDLDFNRVQKYCHKREGQKLAFNEVSVDFTVQRKEPRFIYQTSVKIEYQGFNGSGILDNFSLSGLKVTLDQAITSSLGDIIYITLPELQKITKSFNLKKLPYRVVKVNKSKTIISLYVHLKDRMHKGRSFFKLLIEKNANKLTLDQHAMLTPGLSVALRTLYLVNSVIPSALIQRSGARYKVEVIVAGKESDKDHPDLLADMRRFSDRHNDYNLYPLLGHASVNQVLKNFFKYALSTDRADINLLYIGIKNDVEKVEDAVIAKLASDLKSLASQRTFIEQSLSAGRFYCVQLNVSRSKKPIMESLAPELNYINHHTRYQSQQLINEIKSIVGLFQIIDITQEVLLRHRLSS